MSVYIRPLATNFLWSHIQSDKSGIFHTCTMGKYLKIYRSVFRFRSSVPDSGRSKLPILSPRGRTPNIQFLIFWYWFLYKMIWRSRISQKFFCPDRISTCPDFDLEQIFEFWDVNHITGFVSTRQNQWCPSFCPYLKIDRVTELWICPEFRIFEI